MTVAVAVPSFPPLQFTGVELGVTASAVGSVIVTFTFAAHPKTSVTVIV